MTLLRVLRAFVVIFFRTKRAASPHCRETLFSCPELACGELVEPVEGSAPSDIVLDLGVLFWTFKFKKFEFVLRLCSGW